MRFADVGTKGIVCSTTTIARPPNVTRDVPPHGIREFVLGKVNVCWSLEDVERRSLAY